MPEKNFTLVTAGAGAFLFIAFLTLHTGTPEKPREIAPEHIFPKVALEAKSAYVYDLRTGETLYAKNADARLPLASLTKLMSALVASDIAPEYGTVKVTPEALANYGDSGLKSGEKWTLKNLLDFSLLTSSNDGIRAVALSLAALDKSNLSEAQIIQSFVTSMNKKASELGLMNTYFLNESGLDLPAPDRAGGQAGESQMGGAYGSAKDVSMLLGYILKKKPELLEVTKQPAAVLVSLDNTPHAGKNTNELVNSIPGILGSKTGFTDIAGGNVVFAFDPELGHPIVVAVLGSSAEGRFEDAQKLVNATMAYITQ